jgi:GDP-4-dehydro-6-deoxy-D-mannose reductase
VPRIVVTGAAGFAGRHLIDALVERWPDARIAAWRRPGERLTAVERRAGVTWAEVDVLDEAGVAAAIAGVTPDLVFHLAGAAHVADSMRDTAGTLATNVVGTATVLDAAARIGGCRVVVTGSALVYRTSAEVLTEDAPLGPASPYAVSKLAQELLSLRVARDERMAIVVARPFNHVGPGQSPSFFASSFARQVASIEAGLQPPVMTVGNLDARRDLTDVRDTVRAYVMLAERGTPGRPYNVCSGQAVRVGDVLEALVAASQSSITIRVDPSLLRANDNPVVVGSYDRLRRDTGWAPTVAIERTWADLLAWWRQQVRPGAVSG